jgi:hypothetical protein
VFIPQAPHNDSAASRWWADALLPLLEGRVAAKNDENAIKWDHKANDTDRQAVAVAKLVT